MAALEKQRVHGSLEPRRNPLRPLLGAATDSHPPGVNAVAGQRLALEMAYGQKVGEPRYPRPVRLVLVVGLNLGLWGLGFAAFALLH